MLEDLLPNSDTTSPIMTANLSLAVMITGGPTSHLLTLVVQ
jgi:hypothetical protein